MQEPSLQLAARIEAAEVQVGRALVRAADALFPNDGAMFLELGGGACFSTGKLQPQALVVGMGLGGEVFGGEVIDGDLERMIELLDARQIAAEARVASFAEPSLVPRLVALGFAEQGNEITLARELSNADFQVKLPAGYSIQGLHPGRVEQWVHTVALGSCTEAEMSPAILQHLLTNTAAEGFLGFVVTQGNEIVAAAGVQCAADTAGLFGHATKQRFRQRGLQQALIAHSLAVCSERGITLAKLNAGRDTSSLRNAQRQGFVPVYTRTKLTRAATG